MKKSIFILITLSLFYSCSKAKPPAEGPVTALTGIQESSSLEDLLQFYSSDTRSLVKDLIAARVLSQEEARSLLAILEKDSAFEISSQKIDGDQSTVTVKITAHRIENRVGMPIALSLLLEEGKWVIDMEKDLKLMGEARRKSSTGDYLKKQFRTYQ